MVGNFRKTFRPPTKQENSKMKLNLKIWRQENAQSKGRMVPYTLENVSHHMSFLEMLDVLNEDLIKKGARVGAPDMKYETCVARGFSPCLTADPKEQCRCLTRQIQPTRFSCAISNFGGMRDFVQKSRFWCFSRVLFQARLISWSF